MILAILSYVLKIVTKKLYTSTKGKIWIDL